MIYDVVIDNTVNIDYLLQKNEFIIQLPDDIYEIDLRDKMPPLEYFDILGTTANSLATLIEYDIPNYRCSRMFIYYNERINTTNYNLYNSIKSLIENGFCSYNEYPYDITKLNEEPDIHIYEIAKERKFKFDFIKIKKDLNSLLLSLINNEPFIVSIQIFESFEYEDTIKNKKIPMPKPQEKLLGGITVVVCGFNIYKQVFYIKYLNNYLQLPFFYLLKDNYSSNCFIFILRNFIHIDTTATATATATATPMVTSTDMNIKERIDLRNNFPEVYDQGKIGSCTANSLCSIFEYDNLNFRGSRLFLYYNERLLINETHIDNGAYLEDGIRCLKMFGICKENEFPYNVNNVYLRPPDDCYISAKNNYLIEAIHIDNNLDTIKYWLNKNEPISAGILIFSNFMSYETANTGIVKMPTENDVIIGGHAIVICGYDDTKQIFILRNSWGSYWGDRGYFYLPYEYISNYTGDYWIILKSKVN